MCSMGIPVLRSLYFNSSGFSFSFSSSRHMAPATCGVLIDVPLLVPVGVFMFTPGANMSSVGFTLEKLAMLSWSSVAPMESTLDPQAGDFRLLFPLFPLAAMTSIPFCSTVAWLAICATRFVSQNPVHVPVDPMLRLIISGF